MNGNTLKISPNVEAVIKPIIFKMTEIDTAHRTNPIIGTQNEPDWVKDFKKQCVHIIYRNGAYALSTERNSEGKLVCTACGRVINTKFDDTAVQKLMDAIEVINQILLFGMLNNLHAEPIKTLIDMKRMLPAAAQLLKELNEFVKRDNASSDDASNLGTEYSDLQFNNITRMM